MRARARRSDFRSCARPLAVSRRVAAQRSPRGATEPGHARGLPAARLGSVDGGWARAALLTPRPDILPRGGVARFSGIQQGKSGFGPSQARTTAAVRVHVKRRGRSPP